MNFIILAFKPGVINESVLCFLFRDLTGFRNHQSYVIEGANDVVKRTIKPAALLLPWPMFFLSTLYFLLAAWIELGFKYAGKFLLGRKECLDFFAEASVWIRFRHSSTAEITTTFKRNKYSNKTP